MILNLPVTDHALAQQARQKIREHILMRDVFHCTPPELAELDHSDVLLHWEIREALREVERREEKRMRYNMKRSPSA